jgi:hypothetical protein
MVQTPPQSYGDGAKLTNAIADFWSKCFSQRPETFVRHYWKQWTNRF